MGASSTNTWTRTEDNMRAILVAAVCLTPVAFVSSAPYHPYYGPSVHLPYSWPAYHYSLPIHYPAVSLVAHPNGALVPLDDPAVLHAKQLHAALGGAVHHAEAFSPIVTEHEDLPEPVAVVKNVVAADPEGSGTEPVEVEEDIPLDQVISLRTD